jgi:hypothetical protein
MLDLGIFTLLILGALSSACSVTVTESVDPEANYRWRFDQVMVPKPEIVHSRVEREDPVVFFGFTLPPRNKEWEFEFIASPPWIDVVQQGFIEHDAAGVELRPTISDWFSPDPEHFSAWYLPGSSGVHSAHLFIEKAPRDPMRVRVFIRRY